MVELQAIPTIYKGIQLRSRMEAQCAFLFDQLGWEWKYEAQSLMLSNGTTYIPDFSIGDGDLVVECRGYENRRSVAQLDGFIKDMPNWARRRGEGVTFLVMGPEECLVYECSFETSAVNSFGAFLTYCPRCEEWTLEPQALQPRCGPCAELTFNQFPLMVREGKFTIGGIAFDEARQIFNRDTQALWWISDFDLHTWETLGRPDRKSADWQEFSRLAMNLFVEGMRLSRERRQD